MSVYRKNEDKTINTYGRRLLELTNACGLIFLNGRSGFDKRGSFTFCNHIGKATDDYMWDNVECTATDSCWEHVLNASNNVNFLSVFQLFTKSLHTSHNPKNIVNCNNVHIYTAVKHSVHGYFYCPKRHLPVLGYR